MPRTLWHLTLTTGHGLRSPRSEVTDDGMAMLCPIVRAGHGTIRGLTIDLLGPALIEGWQSFTLGWGEEAVDVFCVLCWDQRGHAEAWREAMEHLALAPVPTPVARFSEPPVPWLTVEVLVGAALQPNGLAMLGDAERCVAWAIIENAPTAR